MMQSFIIVLLSISLSLYSVHPKRFQENKWEQTDFIWNFGLAQIADIGLPKNPFLYFENRNYLPKQDILRLKTDPSIVWTNPDNLKKFYWYLKRVKQTCVLIVSDGDNSFPNECGLSQDEIQDLLNNPRILHVFAQNCDCQHPKVSPIPIGIDFHSLAYKKNFDPWGKQCSPIEQEAQLREVIANVEPTSSRKKRVFVDFQLADNMRTGNFKRYLQFSEDRSTIFRKVIQTGLVDALETPIRRTDLWRLKGQYVFTISPHGNGLDCHRTWEDLALGCIVIVKTSPLDRLFEGLPVVIVKDWDEITSENLEKWIMKFKDILSSKSYYHKLSNQYWLEKIYKKTKVDVKK